MNGMKFHGMMRGWCAREIREGTLLALDEGKGI
jgi:hypothetical protein